MKCKKVYRSDFILSLKPLPVVYVDDLATQSSPFGYHRLYPDVKNFFMLSNFGINLVVVLDKPIMAKKGGMKECVMTNKAEEIRYQPIKHVDQYYSVEFSLSGCAFVYQFKISKVSLKEICVLVRQDSDLLNHLKVGDILNLKYYTTNSFRPVEYLKTEIRHIRKHDQKPLIGLCVVGLLILENENYYK